MFYCTYIYITLTFRYTTYGVALSNVAITHIYTQISVHMLNTRRHLIPSRAVSVYSHTGPDLSIFPRVPGS